MKRIFAALLLLAFIITTIFVGNTITKNICSELEDEIKDFKESVLQEDFSNANIKIEKINDKWHKRKAVLSIFSNHAPLDEITIIIKELQVITKEKDKNISALKSAEAMGFIGRIIEEQKIHLESFF